MLCHMHGMNLQHQCPGLVYGKVTKVVSLQGATQYFTWGSYIMFF